MASYVPGPHGRKRVTAAAPAAAAQPQPVSANSSPTPHDDVSFPDLSALYQPAGQDHSQTPNPTPGPWTGGITGQGQNPSTVQPPPAAAMPQMPIGYDAAKWNNAAHQTPKYAAGRVIAGGGSFDQAVSALGPGYRKYGQDTVVEDATGDIYDMIFDQDNASGQRRAQWTHVGNVRGGAAGGGGAPGTGSPGTGGAAGGTSNVSGQPNVFSDPATTGWETLLRQFVDRLNVPQQTWSPAQMEIQQTQALDPLERQRQARKQQATLQLSQRNMGPGSGPFVQAMADIDRQFDQLRTQTQGNFATQAIGREDQVFQGNEQRGANAVNFMRQIPQLADQRMASAQNSIMQSNPYGLLQLQQQMERDQVNQQQYSQMQNQQFWQQMMQYLIPLFQ